MFCWTERGAEHVGIVQSLLVTCRLHNIDPYEYFVDVLQRVKDHPPSQMDELTSRRWKELFAQKNMRSILHHIDKMRAKTESLGPAENAGLGFAQVSKSITA